MLKGWRAAAHDWIVIADSNVLMPPDYIQRLFASWRADTGLVASPPVGCMPHGFWAEIECAFLNTYQARWQYFADTLGFGFAQGKTMFWRRAVLEHAGGIRALAADPAEDAASTKIVRAAGLKVRLVDAVRAAARLSQRARRLEPPAPLGAAAARELPPILSAGNPFRRRASDDRLGLRCRGKAAGMSALGFRAPWYGRKCCLPPPPDGICRRFIRSMR